MSSQESNDNFVVYLLYLLSIILINGTVVAIVVMRRGLTGGLTSPLLLIPYFLLIYFLYRSALWLYRQLFVPESVRTIIVKYPLHDIGFSLSDNRPFLAETTIFGRFANFVRRMTLFSLIYDVVTIALFSNEKIVNLLFNIGIVKPDFDVEFFKFL